MSPSTLHPTTITSRFPNSFSNTSTNPATPELTPADTPLQDDKSTDLSSLAKMPEIDAAKMEDTSNKDEAQSILSGAIDGKATDGKSTDAKVTDEEAKEIAETKKASKCKAKGCKAHHKDKKRSKGKRADVSSSSSSSSSSGSSSSGSESDSSSSSSEEDRKARRKAAKKRAAKRKTKSRRKIVSSSEDSSDSSSDSSSSEEEPKKKKKKKKKSKVVDEVPTVVDSENEDDDPVKLAEAHLESLRARRERKRAAKKAAAEKSAESASADDKRSKSRSKSRKSKKNSKPAYFRCDNIWDNEAYNWKLCETNAEQDEDQYGKYIFNIRRNMDYQGRYDNTVVDIKSKSLREALKVVMKQCKSVSLEEETPECDPNMLFMYLEEMRSFDKDLKSKIKKAKKRRARKSLTVQRQHLKLMINYLDKDYAKTKETLYPLLEAKLITFEYLWALYKSEDIAYCPTYNDVKEPRAFSIEFATKEQSLVKGSWYQIEGKYLEYDGKIFGKGNLSIEQEAFKGPKPITTLACYPIRYHPDANNLREKLIARGKKFVSLKGMNYRYHKGMAYVKRKRQIIKVNIDGRIMIDPAGHRKINPNYAISNVQPDDPDLLSEEENDDDHAGCCGGGSDGGEDQNHGQSNQQPVEGDEDKPKTRMKLVQDKCGRPFIVEVEVDENGREIKKEKIERTMEDSFTDRDYLIASSVVLGFSFSEKLWLEFSVSGLNEIEWNDQAFESLQLPEGQKSIVKALVTSHSRQNSRNIDDVVQGKGRGLVAVLHGPPGTGKTLTAEGISEFLRCPLYMVSAGELGTSPKELELELTKILEIAHSWGAVLLLDEADVFLEKRTVQDIHRNALVSIFLRLLEYFQGILFLTTNRVETFDEAFQSRIHIALRYGELSVPAKKSVWKLFLSKVKDIEGVKMAEFREQDYDRLAKKVLNGRQIKNAVRTAQSLAVDEGKALCMAHVLRVLGVADDFEKDLKGGTGYEDAMRSYN